MRKNDSRHLLMQVKLNVEMRARFHWFHSGPDVITQPKPS